jgi:antitoxin component YwqK of YwqJK toxin-antitoxin module
MSTKFNYFKIIIGLLLVSPMIYAQKITLAELHTMSSNKNWETSNKFLLSKGWEYYDSQTGDDEHYNTITWSFEKSYLNDKKANGWLYIYSYDGLPNKVMYRFRKKEYYSAIKNMLPSNGYKLDDEEILNQKVIAKYSNPNYILELEYLREEDEEDSYSSSGSYAVYQITVYKKGGVYDPNNGKKQQFDDDGNLAAEYYLKDGEFNGLVTIYNPDGSIKKTKTYRMGVEEGPSVHYFYKEDKSLGAKYFGNLSNGNKNGKWYFNIIEDNAKERNLSYENYVDDIKEGDFREVQNDSVIFCTYKRGLLEGKYRVYTDLNRKVFGFPLQTDTLKITKTSEGHFFANKKVGFWKNYDVFGVLTSEGKYVDSLKTGKWKYYYPKQVGNDNNETEYSGKLYLIANYENGMLNGESVRFSSLENNEIPCEDSTSTEQCYEKIFIELTEKANYKDDILNGPYELYDKNNVLLHKGQYNNGKEHGKWITTNISEIDFWYGETLEIGNYNYGDKEGKWERFDKNNELIGSYHYNKNNLDGEQITFIDKIPRGIRLFKNNILEKVTINDSLGTPKKIYTISDRLGKNFKCRAEFIANNSIMIETFDVIPDNDDEFSPSFFHMNIDDLETRKKILNGYNSLTLNGNLIFEGNYKNSVKYGIWSYYYKEQNVRLDIEYDYSGNITSETYYDLNKSELFDGEFIYKDETNNITEERKIKDGKRNGATRYKDANDKTIKKESYKEGILKD